MITPLDQRLSAFIDSNIHNNRSFDPLDLDAEMMKETGSTSSQSASTSESKPLDQQQQQQQQQQEVNIPVSSYAYGPPPRKLSLPVPYLLSGDQRDQYRKIGIPLYEASIKCDWTAAEAILRKNPDLVWYALTENGDTALHIASSIKRSEQVEKFVGNLVERMSTEALELINKNHNTALYLAASRGNINIVRIMVEKNPHLTTIPGGARVKMMPLYAAAVYGNYEVVKYLYEKSNDLRDHGWDSQNRASLFEKCVEGDMLGKH
ncbi:hypothetical protein M8C21_028304 [Ambrosia artemisiifolia]|uniref:Ankyrin repeat-containing protein n=1 Tax=Ambrosia artemisiifolia TaxID=4212 RepID=A0AAD5D9H8_AMBAR|nr:hypothetical protein M8C21_028304 [Ambrosia artemisiifolia]